MTETAPRSPLRAAARRWQGRARVAQAMVLIAGAGVAQRWLLMPRWSTIIGDHAPVPADWAREGSLPLRSADLVEDRVRRAILSGSRHLPWTPTCLAEATAGQMMLRTRGTAGVVVIGLRRADSGDIWDAHAWLLGARGAITGGQAADGFTATTVFEVPGRLRAVDVDLVGVR